MAIIKTVSYTEPPTYVKTRGKIKRRLIVKPSYIRVVRLSDWEDCPLWSRATFSGRPLKKASKRRTNKQNKKSGAQRLREKRRGDYSLRWRT